MTVSLFHLLAHILISSKVISFCFFSTNFSQTSRKAKIQKNKFLEIWTPHNISWFDIPMDNIEAM